MEKVIIDIIDKRAERQYSKLTPTKRKVYRAMLYAGTQITMNSRTVRDISAEIGYSEDETSKLAQKWIELMRDGDVTINLIIAAVGKLLNSKRLQRKKKSMPDSTEAPISDKIQKSSPTTTIPTRKNKKVLGFVITPEDEMRKRAIIRASILFFQNYGKGSRPRMHGEYYTPGTHKTKNDENNNKWLPLDTAAIYCGCKTEVISQAGQNGVIERRAYKRNANRNYYEYNIADLDRFIRDNHL